MKKRLLFVFNPISGGKKKDPLFPVMEKFCTDNGFEFSFYSTTGDGKNVQNIESIIRRDSVDAVIAVGGDGTVNMVGEALINKPIPLGIIPMGSANSVSRDLEIPKRPEEALNIIKEFHIHAIDALNVNGLYCFHVTDFGFNARIVRRFSQSILRGKISYLWFGLLEFFTFKPFHYVIETEKQTIEGNAFMITVTNANRFGTNVNINPLGEIDDGFFEISIIKPFSFIHSFKILYRLFNNSIHRSRYNRVIRCRKATIHNKGKTSFHIDGEPVQFKEKIEVTIIPRGLQVIMPCCR
jgi:YegS/Rv2252/BmrU family lipid kinase